MRSFGVVAGVALLLTSALVLQGDAAGRFDLKLAPDKQAVHVLNRLTFGPRPGDVEEVRRIGVENWIRQQLRPEQMPADTALEARLKPLASTRLATWEIFEAYQPAQQVIRMMGVNLGQLIPPQQIQKINAGTPEERRATVEALAPDVRQQVLAAIPPQTLQGLPDLQKEAERARQIENEKRNRQMAEQQRKLRPPLNELLTPEQARDLQLGTEQEKLSVLNSFDREKRTLVFRSLPPQQVPVSFKREAMAAMNPPQAVTAELIDAKLYRTVYSTRQLEEVLVDFWLNHFNVYSGKGQIRMLLTSYERDAIRPHVLGRFHDMLLATARHPAMLFYLDNYQSQSPRDDLPTPLGPNGVTVRRPGLNENYARELMELHTLGVNGGYTQKDVIEVARAFTGWTIYEPNRYGEFQFNPAMHDRGEKVVLGRTIPRGGGESDGLIVLDTLARHPSTARFVSRKLAQRFVADDPPAALVDRMAATFTKTDGDLRAVMETLLLSREFLSEGAWQVKMKSPLEMVASSLRALNADVIDTTALAQRLTELGQPLYGKLEPTGYPNTGESWASSAGLLGRVNFATALIAGQIDGVKVDAEPVGGDDIRRAFVRIMGVEPSGSSVSVVEKGLEGKPPSAALLATVLIASPDFQKR